MQPDQRTRKLPAAVSEPGASNNTRGSSTPSVVETQDSGEVLDCVSNAQLQALHAGLGELHVSTDRSDRLAVVGAMLGRPIDSTSELTRREAASLLGVLHREIEGCLS